MIASLSMYDWPEQSGHWDRFWTVVRQALGDHGIAAPDKLTRVGRLWDHWTSPDLVLGQTCGMPYRTRLHGKVTLLGALDHGLTGCPKGFYNSVIVARRGASPRLADHVDSTLAYNGLDSESGWAALQNVARGQGFFFRRKLHSGSHRASATMVADGKADIASIDAETWRLVEAHAPEVADKLTVLLRTPPTPGLPLITRKGVDPAPYRRAIHDAIRAAGPDVLTPLHLHGFAEIPADDYLAVPVPPSPSQDVPAA